MFVSVGVPILAAGIAAALAVFVLRAPAGAPAAFSARRTARCGMVAALYVVLCLALQPLSYGAVQVRVAEALCLLPVFGPEYITAVTLGCFLANLLGSVWQDAVFGTLATFLACLVTYKLRHVRLRGLALPAALPPVVFNALIVGPEIAFFFGTGPATLPVVLFNAASVAMGEIVSCCVLGTALAALIERNAALRGLVREG